MANIKLHSATAKSYDHTQPHFREENVSRVASVLRQLSKEHPRGKVLDVGCGTGFILKIGGRYFNFIVGVDITKAMIEQIRGPSKPDVLLADAFSLSFRDNSFDVCTSYSFLHHLADYQSVLKEIHRCLKPGGTYYNDQDPNYYAFTELRKLKREEVASPLLRGEMRSVNKSDLEGRGKGVSEKVAAMAEFHRKLRDGIREEDMRQALEKAGFSQIQFRYHWYLAQGTVLHEISPRTAAAVERHLRALLPVSRNLFKYFGFIAVK